MCSFILDHKLINHLGEHLPIKVSSWDFVSEVSYAEAEKRLQDSKFEFNQEIYNREKVRDCKKVAIPGLKTYLVSEFIIHDGNDMFRAISMLIEGSQSNHLKYRRALVSYIQDHPELFRFNSEDSREEGLRKMCKRLAKNNQRVDIFPIVLRILAEIYGMNLIVIRDSPRHGALMEHYKPFSDSAQKPFHLLFQYGDHNFELLVPRDRSPQQKSTSK